MKILAARYDVTDLDDAEVDYLAGEIAAQAERSDGHRSVPEPTVEVLDADTADAVDAILERLASHLVVASAPEATVDAWCALLTDARRRLKDFRS